MNTKALRQKILDLAIRGRLVPQDPNDEPASVLLQRIREEKERLINEGKIKRPKKTATADTTHYQNVPFEVPKPWEWVKVEDVATAILYGVSESAKPNGEYKLLRITDIQDNKVNWDDVPFTDFNREKAKSYILQKGDILFARTGATVGKSYLVADLPYVSIYASYLIRIRTCNEISPTYLKLFFESGYYWEQISTSQVGIGQPNVNGSILSNLFLPLPPLSEQKRIVEEIEKWFALIDEIEAGQKDLATLIEQTKSKVLDLAIHGRLVTQNPNDEPAINLLRRINTNFQPCEDTHRPFPIPDSWQWVRLGEVVHPMRKAQMFNKTFKYVDIDSVNNHSHKCKPKVIETTRAPSRASRYTQKGDTVFSMVRPYLKNIAMIEEDDCIASTGFFVCSPNATLLQSYCFYTMLSNYVVDGLNSFIKGDNSPSINTSNVEEYFIPLPPLPEQQRIVAKIDEIFSSLDAIAQCLSD